MSRFKVTKQIDFCYGHRLLNYDSKCKHLHGHNGLLEIVVSTESLDSRGGTAGRVIRGEVADRTG